MLDKKWTTNGQLGEPLPLVASADSGHPEHKKRVTKSKIHILS